MKNNALISIIIPIYNAERFLGECIQSVIEQDYQNWELILINDGSKDSSHHICNQYAAVDNRIKVYHNENHGVSYTRNFGMDMAKGDYLCFIDADDKIASDYLAQLLAALENEDADIVFCGWQLLYGNKTVGRTPKIKAGFYRYEDVSNRAIDDGTLSGILFGAVWGALYRSSLIKDNHIIFDASVKKNEDGLFNLQLLPYAKGIFVSTYDGYIYRQWKSVTNKKKDFVVTTELDEVSNMIRERCKSYNDLEKQLRCRSVSIIFWKSQGVKNIDASVSKLSRMLKNYIEQTDFHDFYFELNFEMMSRYKKALIKLLYKKRYTTFIFLIKYVKPFLEKHLKH